MINRYDHRGLVWVDLEMPSDAEVRQIMDEFQIDPLVAEELLLPSPKPRVEVFDGYLYLILHFPTFRHTHTSGENQEIDFVVGQNFLITARYDTVDPLHKFAKVFEVHSILSREQEVEHGGYLFYYMIRKLYRAVEHELDFLRDELIDIERKIFSGKEKQMVHALSNVSRVLLNFSEILALHRSILESFETASTSVFGKAFGYHSRTIIGQYSHLERDLLSRFKTLDELRSTNDSLLTTKQNEIMKTLTIMAFTTFPLTLIAAIFSMDTIYNPIVGAPFDFWIIIGMMIAATLLFFSFFKYRGWL